MKVEMLYDVLKTIEDVNDSKNYNDFENKINLSLLEHQVKEMITQIEE